jgi:hypothetical protein
MAIAKAQTKELTFTEARKILNDMHFGACVIRNGRARGTKKIWWTSTDGTNYHTPFVRETSWETVVEFAKQQLPVWDKAWLFEVGDVIEFEWFYGEQCRGVILSRGESGGMDYVIQSEAFSRTGGSGTTSITNYSLKFQQKAVKVELQKI